MNINSIFNTGKNVKIFNCDVVRIVNVIFIRHLKPFLIEQRIFQGVYGKNMSLKTPEKATSAGRMEQRAIIKFCVNSGKTPIETKQMMENTKRHRHISRSLVYKWHKRFSDGVCDLKDAERSGRPLLCDDITKSRIHDIVMKDRRLTLREVVSISDVSKSSVFNILTEDFCMSRVCARWVPRLVSDEHNKRRMQTSKAFIQNFKRGGEKWLDRIITTDETWLHHFDPETKTESSIWKHQGSPATKKAKVAKSVGKQIYIFFVDRHGMILVYAVSSGRTGNAAYYSQVLRRELDRAIKKKNALTWLWTLEMSS